MMSFSQATVSSRWGGGPADGKILHDPIHGHIHLDPLSIAIVDTPQFQRLRELKQLGSAYYVFPGASHNRFEHSIGTAHLAKSMLQHLATRQPELEVTSVEIQTMEIAGLCHDLGHGPFSHVFDNEFIPAARTDDFAKRWSHEDMSLAMLDYLVDDNNIEIDNEQLKLVKEYIVGAKAGARTLPPEKAYMYEIVANGRNSIDVDKFDYLVRDAVNLGIKATYDFTRLMNFSRVIRDESGHMEICYHAKEVYDIYELFRTRYTLFRQVYSHKAAKAVEYMIRDVLIEADRAWNGRLSRAIEDPAEYMKLTDCVLKEIEFSTDPELARARELIKDIRCRRLYRFVDEYTIPKELEPFVPSPKPEDISTRNKEPVELRPEDIIVQDFKLNFANKDKDPADVVHFFSHFTDTESHAIGSKSKVSYLLPQHFQERIIRVFCVSRDQEKLKAAAIAFRAFLRDHRSSSGVAAKVPEVSPNPAAGSKAVLPSQGSPAPVWASPDKRSRDPLRYGYPDYSDSDSTPMNFAGIASRGATGGAGGPGNRDSPAMNGGSILPPSPASASSDGAGTSGAGAGAGGNGGEDGDRDDGKSARQTLRWGNEVIAPEPKAKDSSAGSRKKKAGNGSDKGAKRARKA